MDYVVEPERKTPVVAETDVLVCGGGVAGVVAAITAARLGARVLLIEKYGFLGGLMTAGLVITTPPLDNGINSELAGRLQRKGVFAPCRDSGEAQEQAMWAFDPEVVKQDWNELLAEAGVDFLFHTHVADAIVQSGVVRGVIIETKKGRRAIRAKIVVDATGDADIATLAGAPVRSVDRPITMMFTMTGVDVATALEVLGGSWSGLRRFVKAAVDRGDLPFDLSVLPAFAAPGIHAEQLVYTDEVCIWGGMMEIADVLEPSAWTKAEVVTRDHVHRLADFLNKALPGFEHARIEHTAAEVGVRATRMIVGELCPGRDEVVRGEFPDCVVRPYAKRSMFLPFRSLVPQRTENLLVAGRCISAQDDIMGQLRLIPVCSATGEAAGAAAAMAASSGVPPRSLDTSRVRQELTSRGMRF